MILEFDKSKFLGWLFVFRVLFLFGEYFGVVRVMGYIDFSLICVMFIRCFCVLFFNRLENFWMCISNFLDYGYFFKCGFNLVFFFEFRLDRLV